jgi:hypothetical protein
VQPVEKVHVAAGAVLLAHWHAVDQGVGEPLDPPQGTCFTKLGELLALLLVRQSPRPALRLDEVFR